MLFRAPKYHNESALLFNINARIVHCVRVNLLLGGELEHYDTNTLLSRASTREKLYIQTSLQKWGGTVRGGQGPTNKGIKANYLYCGTMLENNYIVVM